jgi:hypothetical protein
MKFAAANDGFLYFLVSLRNNLRWQMLLLQLQMTFFDICKAVSEISVHK